MAAVGAGKRSLTQLFKQGLHEIPEVVGSTFFALAGIALGSYGCYRYYQNDGDNRKYKMTYVIMRSDDPRAARVHKD